MKAIFSLFVNFTLLTLFLNCKAQSVNVDSFLGNWVVSTSTSEFSILINQAVTASGGNSNIISGSHCSTQQNGNRTDCGLDDSDISINGQIGSDNIATITFKSHFKG